MTEQALQSSRGGPGDVCRLLDWDSAFFGFPIASVVGSELTAPGAEAIERWAAEWGVRCLYFFADPNSADSVRVAEDHGYRLTDIRVTYGRPLPDPASSASDPESSGVRLAAAADVPALMRLARVAHRNTRFYRDGRFDPARCDDLYARWIERSCEGWADRVFVAGPVGDPSGYLTVHRDPGDLRLVAVRAEARGQGVGRRLYLAGIRWLAENGAGSVRSPTQAFNIAAQRLFQSVGLHVTSTTLVYHRWFAAPAERTRPPSAVPRPDGFPLP